MNFRRGAPPGRPVSPLAAQDHRAEPRPPAIPGGTGFQPMFHKPPLPPLLGGGGQGEGGVGANLVFAQCLIENSRPGCSPCL